MRVCVRVCDVLATLYWSICCARPDCRWKEHSFLREIPEGKTYNLKRELRLEGNKMVLNIDLNNPPLPADGIVPGGDPVDLSLSIGLPRESGLLQLRTTTSFEPVDDEVIICSPRSFAEARDKARRNRREVEVIDAENIFQTDQSAGSVPITNKRRRRGSPEHTVANVNHPGNFKGNKKTESDHSAEDTEVPCIVVPFQKKPEFKCPVCISPFVEETSTKCGHIFCKKCIHAAIAAQSKCPACRKKLKVKDTIRIYLPASD